MSLNASQPQRKADGADDIWNRGRQPRQTSVYLDSSRNGSGNWGVPGQGSPQGSFERYISPTDKRAASPNSARSGRFGPSSANSLYSSNWRSPTPASAFTRNSNSSARSVATNATSVSASSWRSQVKASPLADAQAADSNLKNINVTSSRPWELGQSPRQVVAGTLDNTFGKPSVRKNPRTRKQKDSTLDTINERSGFSPLAQDASTSTTDLGDGEGDGDVHKKVQKGQINALAKMLSALRR